MLMTTTMMIMTANFNTNIKLFQQRTLGFIDIHVILSKLMKMFSAKPCAVAFILWVFSGNSVERLWTSLITINPLINLIYTSFDRATKTMRDELHNLVAENKKNCQWMRIYVCVDKSSNGKMSHNTMAKLCNHESEWNLNRKF